MQNQVPLWVTLALAVIAIMGPIGGAVIGGTITARRDDRRWQLELEREENRRKHEIERESERFWLNRRAETYSSVIEKWNTLARRAGVMVAHLNGAKSGDKLYGSAELVDSLDRAVRELELALAQSEVCSTKKIQFLAVNAEKEVAQLHGNILRAIILLKKEENAQAYIEKARIGLKRVKKLNARFVFSVKSELSIPGGTWDEFDNQPQET